MENIEKNILEIPIGYSIVTFRGKKYGVSKIDFNNGKSTKIYAEERGGNDYISFNFYCTQRAGLLRPCELPKKKVLAFLAEMKPFRE